VITSTKIKLIFDLPKQNRIIFRFFKIIFFARGNLRNIPVNLEQFVWLKAKQNELLRVIRVSRDLKEHLVQVVLQGPLTPGFDLWNLFGCGILPPKHRNMWKIYSKTKLECQRNFIRVRQIASRISLGSGIMPQKFH